MLPLVLAVAVAAIALVVVRRGPAGRDAANDNPPPRIAPTATGGPARSLTDDQRQAMLDVLKADPGPERKIWFQVEQNRPEALAYQQTLEKVFKDAGWDVQTAGSGGMVFKPGVYLLVGDDEWPSYASTAYDALQKAGIDVKAARGYRAYYEEQKKEKPGWQGPKLAADQSYVVLIGPSPAS